jgi:hypothetical protein
MTHQSEFERRWNREHAVSSYTIRVRDREQWETTVHKGGDYPSKHRRRVTRWGPWKTHRFADTATQAIAQLEAVQKLHPLSDAAVFQNRKRLEREQLAQRARNERTTS